MVTEEKENKTVHSSGKSLKKYTPPPPPPPNRNNKKPWGKGGNWFTELLYYLKLSSYQQKLQDTQIRKLLSHVQGKKQSIETIPEEAQTLGILAKNYYLF